LGVEPVYPIQVIDQLFHFIYLCIYLLNCQNTGCGFLLNSMFDFAERFNELQLTDEEMALFSALIVVASG